MALNASQADGSAISERLWNFAGREFDESRLELRVNGEIVELELKPLEILLQLLLHAGKVVTKDQLLDAIWPDVTVEEGSLRFHMASLRKALGDGKDGARYITTLAGRGYCFVAPVSRSAPLPARSGPARTPPWTRASSTRTRTTSASS